MGYADWRFHTRRRAHSKRTDNYLTITNSTAQDSAFGREAQVEALLRLLEDHRFVAVVGTSGSGKSSLVHAGLLPAVREGFLLLEEDLIVTIKRTTEYPVLGKIGQALRSILGKFTEPQADSAADALVAALKHKGIYDGQARALGEGLAACVGRLGDLQT